MKNKFALPKIQLPKLSAKGKRALAAALFALAATFPAAAAEKVLILAGVLSEPTPAIINGNSGKSYVIDDRNPDTIDDILFVADTNRTAIFNQGDLIIYLKSSLAGADFIPSHWVLSRNGRTIPPMVNNLTQGSKAVLPFFDYPR